MKVSNNFIMQEFIPPKEYATIMKLKTEQGRLKAFYKLVDKRIVELAQFYREFFKVPIIINNWHSGGTYTLRGMRPTSSKVGAKHSMHKSKPCGAFDCDVKGKTAEQVRDIIMDNQELFYSKGLRRLEDDVTWIHNDLKITNLKDKIYVFKP